jgi:hypothetical protein
MGVRGLMVFSLLMTVATAVQGQDARLGARLPGGLVTPVQSLVDSARNEKLPTEPLIQKALEGYSKGADSARIVSAVRGLLGQLGVARTALGPDAREADLVAGAACLRAGADPTMLSELRALSPGRSVAVPLGVLSDLVAAGVRVPRAWDAVRDVARTGGPDAEYLALRDRMAEPSTAQSPPVPERPRVVPPTKP